MDFNLIRTRYRSRSASVSLLLLMALFWVPFLFSARTFTSFTWQWYLFYSRLVLFLLPLIFIPYAIQLKAKIKNIVPTYYCLAMCNQAIHGGLEPSNQIEFYSYVSLFFVLNVVGYRGNYLDWIKKYLPFVVLAHIVPLITKDALFFQGFGQFVSDFTFNIALSFFAIILLNITVTRHLAIQNVEQLNYQLMNEQNLRLELVQSELNLAKLKLQSKERFEILSKIATQVAHDIRSPLAALGALEPQMHMLPENTRILVRSAISRIHDIANNLLANSKVQDIGGAFDEPTSTQLVTAIIDPLISEKRLQLRIKPGVELIWNVGALSYGLFANLQPIEFKRILSNIINNAAEALPENTGKIFVSVSSQNITAGLKGMLKISVRDNGKGIPVDILRKLGVRGETFGKENGNGLGLYHAKEFLEKWGGSLTIESETGHGTSVTLLLPQVMAPDWFVSKLVIFPKAKVYLLDDDYSIHRIWKGRLESTAGSAHGVVLKTFTLATDFEAAVKAEKPDLCLLDYELAGQEVTGLDVVQKLGIGVSSILVSSRFEEPQIHARAVSLKMKILPKGMTGLVPIELQSDDLQFTSKNNGIDAVLIDDDALVQLTWEYSANAAGKKIRCFKSPESFYAVQKTIHQSTPIYIDVSLAEGVKGDQVAKFLHEQGFTNLFLATGYNSEQYNHLVFLKGVIGKEPPWSS